MITGTKFSFYDTDFRGQRWRFDVVIDTGEIARVLARKAMKNRTRRSSIASMARVKATPANTKDERRD